MKKKNVDNSNIKLYIILALLLVIIGLVIFVVVYAFNNKNNEDVKKLNDFKAEYTLNEDQLDKVELPEVNEKITLEDLPNTTDTLTQININTLKKLFQTNKKSILFLMKNDCSFCEEFEPRVKEVLDKLKVKAYKINLSDLKQEERAEMLKYINFNGTPTTYTIRNGKVTHTLTGSVDDDTFASFIDYFYLRSN